MIKALTKKRLSVLGALVIAAYAVVASLALLTVLGGFA